jgi:carbamoyl-phosphate synthase large subunit
MSGLVTRRAKPGRIRSAEGHVRTSTVRAIVARPTRRATISVLLTCVGRRVSLLKAFRSAARRLGLSVCLCGADVNPLSPAFQLCDERLVVPPTTDRHYLNQLLRIVRRFDIRLLVPTVDLDLRLLAEHKGRFEKAGCRVLVSDPHVIDICQDKRRTFRFLRSNGFETPMTWSIRAALSAEREGTLAWPCFLKPWDGHAGKGGVIVHDREGLLFYSKRVPKAICQEWVEGVEYTCDVYVDFGGRVRCAVPRRRMEVRHGEVSKAQVDKHPRIMNEVARLVERLGAGPGVITVQVFLTKGGSVKFIEINPRFGGGAPLSIRAGADFPKWILQELTGKEPRIGFDTFQDGLTMLRYDAEVWVADPRVKA